MDLPDRIVGGRFFRGLARWFVPAAELFANSQASQMFLASIFGTGGAPHPAPPVLWRELLTLGVWVSPARKTVLGEVRQAQSSSNNPGTSPR